MKIIATSLLFLSSWSMSAQTIKGKVFGETSNGKEILPGALIQWLGTTTATTANENGVFELSTEGISDKRLIVTELGFKTDTLRLEEQTYLTIILRREANELKSVTIRDNRAAYISSQTIKTEIINQRELSKAACCDLAGCFGTQASVQPQTTNVLTNAQELRILGLSGVYNQVLIDGLPLIQGLSYTYGISTYPGTMIDFISVSKGTTSVLQGFESISGQINLESKHADQAEKLFVNAYVNSFGEAHFNTNIASAVGKKKKWHSLLTLHSVQAAAKIDGNKDGFLDLPQLTRYMAFNKWEYGKQQEKGFATQIGLRLVNEKRLGGQMNFNAQTDKGSNNIYGQSVQYTQPEMYVKSSYRFSSKNALSLALSGFYQHQQSWFGITQYKAKQQNVYVNLQHEWQWHKTHGLKYGMSYRYQNIEENISFSDNSLGRSFAGNYKTLLKVPGVFAENTFHWREDKVVWIIGARLDKHQIWGNYFTPRSMLKYSLNHQHTFRASLGRGWRQVNLFSEQNNLLVGSRDVLFVEPLKPEEAINFGISHTYKFEAGKTTGTLSVDGYSTHFSNQFFPDYDSDPTKAIIKNFTGISRSNGLQVEASFVYNKQIEFRTAYNYLDVFRIENKLKSYLPFNPRNRAMAALSYRSKNNQWQADANAHWFDKMQLPNTSNNPIEYRRGNYSTAFITFNLQATFRYKTFEIYAGCENLSNYRQANPIISASNPFGKYFDLSSVWGPTRGREFYCGVRYSIQ